MIDLIQEIASTLQHNKLRTALTGFAVSWGIFLLIVLLAMATGVVNSFDKMFGQMDYETMDVRGGFTEKSYKGLTEGRSITLKEGDGEVIKIRNHSEIKDVIPTIKGSAKISTGKDYDDNGYSGVTPNYLTSSNIKVTEGRFINQLDINQGRRVIVIGSKAVPVLFDTDKVVGKTVEINGLTFTVIGVYDHQWERSSFMPYTTARQMAGGSDEVEGLQAKLRNVTTQEQGTVAEQNLRATLGRKHQFDPDDQSAVWIHNQLLDHLRMQGAMSGLQLAVWLIGILTLLSGIVGVSNIMFVSVRERTHEIGVRRAIGARPLSILKQVILESVAITTLFGYVGIVAGVIVSEGLGKLFEGPNSWIVNPSVGLGVCLEVTLVLIVAGALAGLFPAIKALKVKPVEALMEE